MSNAPLDPDRSDQDECAEPPAPPASTKGEQHVEDTQAFTGTWSGGATSGGGELTDGDESEDESRDDSQVSPDEYGEESLTDGDESGDESLADARVSTAESAAESAAGRQPARSGAADLREAPGQSSGAGDEPVAPRSSPERAGEPDDPRAERVAAAVRGWQRHLVDLGGRNSLLWYRDLPSGTLDLTTAHPGGLAKLLAGRPTRLSELVREPAALEEARRRARVIRAKTIELREERGISAGFIAVGMATWEVRGAARPPAAPVLLRTCALRPTAAAQRDFDVDLGPDAELNPVLVHYLRSEQGIEVDADTIIDLAGSSGGFDPQPVFAEVARLCRRVPGLRIVPRVVIGTFSYAKLPMVADLSAQGEALADHDVIAAIAGDAQAQRSVRRSLPDTAADPDPEREHLVLDADSTQQAAIDAVLSGAHLVVKGPPGTGKSQTIANLIAALAGSGKRVLFVAEKRAAIDAVLGRLDRLGLADLVLDAYDGATDRRRIAAELGATLDRTSALTDPDTTSIGHRLRERRERLVDHVTALHERRDPWGVTAFEAQEALTTLSAGSHPPVSRVRLSADALRGLTRERIEDLTGSLVEAASLGAWTSGRAPDPWYGARITSSEEAARALDIATRMSSGELAEVRAKMAELASEAGLPSASTAADWAEALELMGAAKASLNVFWPQVFDSPLDDLVAATGTRDQRRAAGADIGVLARVKVRRQARSLLRPGPMPADLHASLHQASDLRGRWQELAGAGSRPVAPREQDEARARHDPAARDLAWLGERLEATREGGDLLSISLDELQERLTALTESSERLFVVPRVVTIIDELRGAGLGPLVDDLARRGVPATEVPGEARFVWWTSLLADIGVRDQRYGAHDGDHLRRVAQEYVETDHAHLDATVGRVRGAVGRQVREVLADHPDQESLVRGEAGKSRRHLSLRDLLPRACDVLTTVKPCWAMSPLVVASVLPPGQWFDVVIFDEASQIPPAQAISAISRARQVVVAGDERQLPPTSFFTAAVDDLAQDGEPDGTDGFESVLDVLAATLPTRQLSWHYRSLDERLIAFANAEIYDGSLVTFPGTDASRVITLETVDGTGPVGDGGEAIESTTAEVDRVIELVIRHARERSGESLGVIALGVRHAARIEDALRVALADAHDIAHFFHEDMPERFFVKNLERVQGDERDAIILSIGYGRTPHGRVLHRFGPINLEGGHRRLNVAVTRARRRMTVVSSFTAQDLDPDRLHSAGAVMLRDFLLYAATGGQPSAAGTQTATAGAQGAARPSASTATTEGTDPAADLAAATARPVAVGAGSGVSAGTAGPAAPAGTSAGGPLLADLATRLRAEGLVVRERFGSGAHRIDLVVDDPRRSGAPVLAVESDGPSYAAMGATRDRDRLRVEQLRRLGWEHLRVWTTDLFRDPARDAARVHGAVWASSNVAAGVRPDGSARPLSGLEAPDDVVDPIEPLTPIESLTPIEPLAPIEPVDQGGRGDVGHVGDRSASAGAEQQPPTGPVERDGRAAGSPEQTRDDTDAGWGEHGDEREHDRWMNEQRPPHWE